MSILHFFAIFSTSLAVFSFIQSFLYSKTQSLLDAFSGSLACLIILRSFLIPSCVSDISENDLIMKLFFLSFVACFFNSENVIFLRCSDDNILTIYLFVYNIKFVIFFKFNIKFQYINLFYNLIYYLLVYRIDYLLNVYL